MTIEAMAMIYERMAMIHETMSMVYKTMMTMTNAKTQEGKFKEEK